MQFYFIILQKKKIQNDDDEQRLSTKSYFGVTTASRTTRVRTAITFPAGVLGFRPVGVVPKKTTKKLLRSLCTGTLVVRRRLLPTTEPPPPPQYQGLQVQLIKDTVTTITLSIIHRSRHIAAEREFLFNFHTALIAATFEQEETNKKERERRQRKKEIQLTKKRTVVQLQIRRIRRTRRTRIFQYYDTYA